MASSIATTFAADSHLRERIPRKLLCLFCCRIAERAFFALSLSLSSGPHTFSLFFGSAAAEWFWSNPQRDTVSHGAHQLFPTSGCVNRELHLQQQSRASDTISRHAKQSTPPAYADDGPLACRVCFVVGGRTPCVSEGPRWKEGRETILVASSQLFLFLLTTLHIQIHI